MRRPVVLVAALLAVPALPGCARQTTTGEQSYRIDQTVDALTVDARAAAVTIEAGPGAATVTEKYRYSKGKPSTSHRVDGRTLALTESGCGDDDARCEVAYRIQVPARTTVQVDAQAGTVTMAGLAAHVRVTTEAGAVRGTGMTADEVTVRTQAGATELDFAEAPTTVVAQTQVGAVRLRLPRDVRYAVTVGAEVGRSEVSVDQDPSSGHRIDVHTQVGAVRIEPLP